MSAIAGRQRLLEDSVLCMSPAELVQAVLNHALLHFRCLMDGDGEDWSSRRRHLLAVQRSVSLLMESLSPPGRHAHDPVAEAQAARFRSLYVFVLDRLVEADRSSDAGPLNGIERVLQDLADGWEQGVLRRG